MTGLGFLAVLLAAAGLWLARGAGPARALPRFLRVAVWAIALPFVANLAGWIFTEMGRQPWVVQGLLLTKDAVSPTVGPWSVGLTLAGFTAALRRARRRRGVADDARGPAARPGRPCPAADGESAATPPALTY